MQNDPQLEIWIEAAQQGDVDAFGRIVSHIKPRIAMVVSRYAAGKEDREDLLQDVFIRAFRSLKNFKAKGSFEGWVYRIAIHTSLDWLRAKMRRHEKPETTTS